MRGQLGQQFDGKVQGGRGAGGTTRVSPVTLRDPRGSLWDAQEVTQSQGSSACQACAIYTT